MAHGPLKKSTQINTKQHVVFLLYQCDGCTCSVLSVRLGLVTFRTTQPSYLL